MAADGYIVTDKWVMWDGAGRMTSGGTKPDGTSYVDSDPLPDGFNGTSQLDLFPEDEKKPTEGWATKYYELPDGATEIGDLIEYRDMNFNVGNMFKACYRLGHKEGVTPEYDLNKIIYFAERELERRKQFNGA